MELYSSIDKVSEALNKKTGEEYDSAKTWNKLTKMDKVEKINNYVDIELKKMFSLKDNERNDVKNYLKNCLDQKRLQRIKDVKYDKDTQTIQNIPGLQMKINTRKFTLKHSDRKNSTLKNLGNGTNKQSMKVLLKNNKIE